MMEQCLNRRLCFWINSIMSDFCNCRNTPRCNLKPGTQCCWDYRYPVREKKNVPDTPLPKPIDHGDGLPF